MDTVTFACSACGFQKSVPAVHSGKKTKCPQCQAEGRVGTATAATSQSPQVIKFRCPLCDQKLGAAVQHAGKWIKCAKCQNPAQVPQPEEAIEQSGIIGGTAAVTPPDPIQSDDLQQLAAMERMSASIAVPQPTLSLAPVAAPAEQDLPPDPTRYSRDASRAIVLEGNPEAEATVRNSASWLFLIAGLSVVNTILSISGVTWVFALGLGVTQVMDYIRVITAREAPAAVMLVTVIAIILEIIITAVYVMLGIFARKGKRWAFVVAAILYGFDTLLSFLSFSVICIGLHIWAMVSLIRGAIACGEVSESAVVTV